MTDEQRHQEFSATAAELPQKRDPSISNTISRPPQGIALRANDFPEWKDPVHDELNPDAYKIIRRTDCVAYPIKKLGTQLAARQWKVIGSGSKAATMQKIVDLIPNKSTVIRQLTWGIVEGYIFGHMVWAKCEGFWIPRIDVRSKQKAGGLIVWDGKNAVIIDRRYLPTARRRALQRREEKDLTPKLIPRSQLVVWQFNPSDSPEGQEDIAWQLYLLAERGQEADKVGADYIQRFVVPIRAYKKDLENVRPTAVQGVMENAAEKLHQSKGQILGMSIKDIIETMEPSGTTAQIINEERQDVRDRAHQIILENTLTSDVSAAGPTGSSSIHKSQQDMAVDSVGQSMQEALSRDLLPQLEFYNAPVLLELDGEIERLELVEGSAGEVTQISNADLQGWFDKGLEMETEAVYDSLNMPVPPGMPDFITANDLKGNAPAQPDPFGGGLGGFGAPAGGGLFGAAPFGEGDPFDGIEDDEDDPATQGDPNPQLRLSALITTDTPWRGELLQLNTFEDETDAQVSREQSEMVSMVDEAIASLVNGREINARFVMHLADVYARAHLAGQQGFRRVLPIGVRNQLASASRVAPMLKLRDSREALTELARLYRSIAVDAARLASRTLQQRLTSKLAAFLEDQEDATPRDTEDFVAWMQRNTQTSEAYSRLVLRNAVNSAYTAGRLSEFRRIAPVFNLRWRYVTAADERVRDDHQDHHGAVFPADSRWLRKLPPSGHNCRCSWVVTTDPPSSDSRLSNLPTLEWEDNPVAERLPLFSGGASA